jgi:hypothetical protein
MAALQHLPPLLSVPGAAASEPGEANGSNFPDAGCPSAAAESQADAVAAAAAAGVAPAPTGGRRQGRISESRSSRYRGVQWDRSGSRWRARLHTDKTRHIGYFQVEEEAAMAWDLAFLRYYGETKNVPKLNFGATSIARYRAEPGAAVGSLLRTASLPSGAPRGGGAGGGAGGAASKYRGVQQQEDGWFRAVLLRNRNQVTVGLYATAEEAARAYDRAAIEDGGWGALTNFPIADYEAAGGAGAASAGAAATAATAAVAVAPRRAALQRSASASAAQAQLQLRLQRTASGVSLDRLGLPSRQASVQNMQQLSAPGGAAPWPPAAAAAAYTPPAGFILQHHASLGAPSASAAAAAAAYAAHLPPDAATSDPQDQRKRARQQEGGGASPGAAAAAASGVRCTSGGAWEASLVLQLGSFSCRDDAERAYDRAALMCVGLTARTHAPLQAALARAAAAGPPQLLPAQPGGAARATHLGVTHRAGAYLATLDVGGKPYELGPFGSAELAARAYDCYSLMLHGVRAHTNAPLWEHLSSPQEVAALAAAVAVVAQAAAAAPAAPVAAAQPT